MIQRDGPSTPAFADVLVVNSGGLKSAEPAFELAWRCHTAVVVGVEFATAEIALVAVAAAVAAPTERQRFASAELVDRFADTKLPTVVGHPTSAGPVDQQ